jgi:hypothetical protein
VWLDASIVRPPSPIVSPASPQGPRPVLTDIFSAIVPALPVPQSLDTLTAALLENAKISVATISS